jgi:hypothetical protein
MQIERATTYIHIYMYTYTIASHLETVPKQPYFTVSLFMDNFFDAPKMTFAQSNNVSYHIVPIVSFILEVAVLEVISKAISSPPSSLLL